jgi:toxin secretion/phage lysis holin
MSEFNAKAFIAALGGVIIYYLGGWDVAFRALLVFMVLDYVTGVSNAWYQRKLNSYTGARGIAKKVGLLILVAVATQIDMVTGGSSAVRSITIMFLAANEALSILENLAQMDVPIPNAIRQALEAWKAKDAQNKDGGQ